MSLFVRPSAARLYDSALTEQSRVIMTAGISHINCPVDGVPQRGAVCSTGGSRKNGGISCSVAWNIDCNWSILFATVWCENISVLIYRRWYNSNFSTTIFYTRFKCLKHYKTLLFCKSFIFNVIQMIIASI